MSINITANFTETFKVSEDKDSTPIDITCEFDLSLLSEEDVLEYARRSMVIAQQSRIRAWMKSDRSKENPSKSYKVPKPGTKTGADPLRKATDMLKKLSPEMRAALLASLGE